MEDTSLKQIILPYKFKPRDYQVEFYKKFDEGIKRIILVHHRRAGKDKACFNLMVREAMKVIGAYYYFAPTYSQGQKIIWKNIDKEGWKMLNHIPREIIAKNGSQLKINQTEMSVELINGSFIQIIGTENIDTIVGTNPRGVVYTEYSLQNPNAWNMIRPILAENGGWAIFNYTPRGENHAFDLLENNKDNPNWFCSIKTVDDTKVLSPEVLAEEKRQMKLDTGDDALFEQEYYCNFNAAIQGSYYGKWLKELKVNNHITKVPYDPSLVVSTYWDLGMKDSMVIWFMQQIGNEIRLIDYYESTGEGLEHYIKYVKDKRYVYAGHWAPHDIRVKELGTGKTRYDVAYDLGIEFNIVPNIGVQDGIDAVRRLLPMCWFDEEKCDIGIQALRSYTKKWDELRKTFKNEPEHDWASHAADAFRYLAVAIDTSNRKTKITDIYEENARIARENLESFDEYKRFDF